MISPFYPPPGKPNLTSAESAEYINLLDPTLPDGSDRIGQGDDHIRIIKSATQNTFNKFIGVKAGLNYSVESLNFLKNKINSIGNITYYIPQKTIYDGNPTGNYSNNLHLVISINETITGNNKRPITPKEDLPPIGHIFISVLTEKKINETYGITYTGSSPNDLLIFKLCDGSSITNSKFFNLTGIANVPDMKTNGTIMAYLPDNTINAQSQDTSYPKDVTWKAKMDLSLLNSSIQSDAGHNHTSGEFMYPMRTVASNQSLYTMKNYLYPSARPNALNVVNGFSMSSVGTHTHKVTFGNATIDFTSDTETKPKTIQLNHFMRIN